MALERLTCFVFTCVPWAGPNGSVYTCPNAVYQSFNSACSIRWFAKRQLSCELWDGVTDFRIEETDREREERLKKWENFLESDKGKEKTEGNTTKCTEEGVESSSKPEETQKAGSNSTSNTESVDAT